MEKWPLDCARRDDESLSHLAGGWRQKLDLKTVTGPRSLAQADAEQGDQGFVIQGLSVCSHGRWSSKPLACKVGTPRCS